jgi:hypothetical protein
VVGQHLQDFDLPQRSHGKAVLVVQHFHLLDGELLVGVLVSCEEDDSVGSLSDDVSFLELADESAIQ